jgi:tetratricopeptide (TPR) repeat protein
MIDSMPVEASPPPRRDRARLPALVQREVVLVVVLALVAVAMFGLTRSLAEWSHATVRAVAIRWYDEGQALVASGRLDDGIAALRKAVARDRLNATYVLALVRALIAASQDDEARRLLLQLREREPDRPEINFRLARLAASSGDTAEAIRYYNHAMYGVDPEDARFDRRRIRLELATFLLDRGRSDDAVGELSALARDTPEMAADHLELAELFLRAGEARAALAQFTAALRREPANARAAAGAGDAAFALGSFVQAERQLQAAVGLGDTTELVRERLELTHRIRAISPLALGLSSTERARRLRAGLSWAAARLATCDAAGKGSVPGDSIRQELDTRRRESLARLREPETIGAGVDLILRAVRQMPERCADRDPDEAAWLALAVLRGAEGGAG